MSPALIPLLTALGALLIWLPGLVPQRLAERWPARQAGTGLAALLLTLALILALGGLRLSLSGDAIRSGFTLPGGAVFALRLDALALIFLCPMLLSALAVSLTAGGFFARGGSVLRFQGLLLALVTALSLVILADPVWLAAAAWALAALFSFLLCWRAGDLKRGPGAALPALLTALLAGGMIFTGLVQLGDLAGGREITLISHRGQEIALSGQHILRAILILTGALIGAGLVPFRFARSRLLRAPSPALAFVLPAGQGLAAIYLVARLVPALAGGPELAGGDDAPFWATTLAGLSLLTLLIGGASALSRRGLSGIAEGALCVPLALAFWLAGLGLTGALSFVILAAVPAGTVILLCAALIRRETGSPRLSLPGGLIRHMPVTAALVLLALLSLTGAAPFAGWHALSAAVQSLGAAGATGPQSLSGWIGLIGVIAGMGLIVAALLRALRLMLCDAPVREGEPNRSLRDPRAVLLAAPVLLIVLLLAAGLLPETIAALAGVAAAESGEAITLWPGSDGITPWIWLAAVGIGFFLNGTLRDPAEGDHGKDIEG